MEERLIKEVKRSAQDHRLWVTELGTEWRVRNPGLQEPESTLGLRHAGKSGKHTVLGPGPFPRD